MTIYFDMDGTLVNLYEVDNWLERLRASDASPYMEAAPMLPLNHLARQLNRLQMEGYHIGVISWLSKDATPEYDREVRMAKKKWLMKHMPSVCWDEIHLIKYGSAKHFACQDPNGILFDDNEKIANLWRGQCFSPEQIMEVVKLL